MKDVCYSSARCACSMAHLSFSVNIMTNIRKQDRTSDDWKVSHAFEGVPKRLHSALTWISLQIADFRKGSKVSFSPARQSCRVSGAKQSKSALPGRRFQDSTARKSGSLYLRYEHPTSVGFLPMAAAARLCF